MLLPLFCVSGLYIPGQEYVKTSQQTCIMVVLGEAMSRYSTSIWIPSTKDLLDNDPAGC